MDKEKLPEYYYLTESEFYEKLEANNYLGLAQIKGYNSHGFNELDKVVYIAFKSSNRKLIEVCISEIVDTIYPYWKSQTTNIYVFGDIVS